MFLPARTSAARICEKIDCTADDLTLKDGHAIIGNRRIPLPKSSMGGELSAEGHAEPGDAEDKVRQATYGSLLRRGRGQFGHSETRVRRMLGVFAAGRILNAKTARSQCWAA